MAMMRNLRRQRQSLPGFVKILLTLAAVLAAAGAGFIFYFNGNNVRDPLLRLINEVSTVEVNFREVEFSPLYPDTLKLSGVSFNRSSVAELYIEYDLASLMGGEDFVIRDFYARGVHLDRDDFRQILNDRLGFKTVTVESLSLVDTLIESSGLTLPHAGLELKRLVVGEHGFTHGEARLAAARGTMFGEEIKNLNVSYTLRDERCFFDALSLNVLGGALRGSGTLDSAAGEIAFTELALNKLILRQDSVLPLKLKAPSVQAEKLSIVLANGYIGELSGSVSNLSLGEEGLSCDFTGQIGELSYPGLNLTLDSSDTSFKMAGGRLSFNSRGQYLEGDYALSGSLNLGSGELILNDLRLNHVKLEPSAELLEALRGETAAHRLKINNLSLTDIIFISHIDSLPLSLKELELSLTGLSFDAGGGLEDGAAIMGQIKARGGFYSDLYFDSLNALGNLTAELASLSLTDLTLRKSTVNGSFSYNRQNQSFYLVGAARGFELGELNSDLIPRLLSGKIDLSLDLKGRLAEESLLPELQGTLKLQGGSLLISGLGLDLINGGGKRNLKLTLTELLNALRDADIGLESPALTLSAQNGSAEIRLDTRTSSSTIVGRSSVNLSTGALSGLIQLVSLPRDSVTSVRLGGDLEEPLFDIRALERGERRRGLLVWGKTKYEPAPLPVPTPRIAPVPVSWPAADLAPSASGSPEPEAQAADTLPEFQAGPPAADVAPEARTAAPAAEAESETQAGDAEPEARAAAPAGNAGPPAAPRTLSGVPTP